MSLREEKARETSRMPSYVRIAATGRAGPAIAYILFTPYPKRKRPISIWRTPWNRKIPEEDAVRDSHRRQSLATGWRCRVLPLPLQGEGWDGDGFLQCVTAPIPPAEHMQACKPVPFRRQTKEVSPCKAIPLRKRGAMPQTLLHHTV